jgi:hypothetical protein
MVCKAMNKKQAIPTPAHPYKRREALPWQQPKATEEDPEALQRVQAILDSPSYRRADNDIDFLARDGVRGVRLELDYLKPELLLRHLLAETNTGVITFRDDVGQPIVARDARTGAYYIRPFGWPVVECFFGGEGANDGGRRSGGWFRPCSRETRLLVRIGRSSCRAAACRLGLEPNPAFRGRL